MGGKVLELEVDKYIDAYEEAEKQKHKAIINEKIVKQYYIKKRPIPDIAAEFNVTEDYVTTVISED